MLTVSFRAGVEPPFLPVEMAFGWDDLEGRITDCRVASLLAMTAFGCGDTVGRGFNPAAFIVVHPERHSRKALSPTAGGEGDPIPHEARQARFAGDPFRVRCHAKRD